MADQQSSEFTLLESSQEIVAHIAHRLIKQKATVMIAESATGGLVQHLLTQIPGSSAFYQGGIIAYSNELKQRLLQVPKSTLEKYGAVSSETAAAMANGVRLWMNTDYGVASTGIAGPTGGTSSKPVGLVFIAVSHHSFETITQQHHFVGTRYDNKLNFSRVVLQLLLDSIKEED